jgi:hypothetical protein
VSFIQCTLCRCRPFPRVSSPSVHPKLLDSLSADLGSFPRIAFFPAISSILPKPAFTRKRFFSPTQSSHLSRAPVQTRSRDEMGDDAPPQNADVAAALPPAPRPKVFKTVWSPEVCD